MIKKTSLFFTRISFILLLIVAQTSFADSNRIQSAAGITVELNDASGHYSVASKGSGWEFGGDLGSLATQIVNDIGSDQIGTYHELIFSWQTNQNLHGSIRAYDNSPTALFRLTVEKSAHELPVRFPDFTSFPGKLHHFSFADDMFAPPRFKLEKGGTPWLLFDDSANAAVLSPANQFMITTMAGDGVREMANELNPGVHDLPAGFSFATVVTFGAGIHATWTNWGNALLSLSGKIRPANDADIGLRYLGCWTDNGGCYYYNYNTNIGYAGTLEKLVEHYHHEQIPIRYLQLDSWWYYKTFTSPDGKIGHIKNPHLPAGEWNCYGGLMKYEAVPAVLPDGLLGFHNSIHLPLITHNRWIDPASPYHKEYKIAGIAGVDPNWWNHIIGHIADGGVVCYEQDWLNFIYERSPELKTTPGLGDAFTDGMANAARKDGLSLQYCMALPRFFLQGSRYENLTTIRTSPDRFERRKWDNFLYTSQLAGAMGIWPWTDVFMSSETNNLLISILSGGMVGTGDPMGKEDKANLLCVARPDGVLVKPDAPLLPLDDVYVAQAQGQKPPMVAWTYSDHGPLRNAYVFTYNRQEGHASAEFTPSELGLKGTVCVLDVRANKAWFQPSDNQVAVPLKQNGTAYYLLALVGQSGLAFFGDAGKFVSCGQQRIASMIDHAGKLDVTVTFAAGEKSVSVFGYSKKQPKVAAKTGSVDDLQYDPETHRFSVTVHPSITVIQTGMDPVQKANVMFQTE